MFFIVIGLISFFKNKIAHSSFSSPLIKDNININTQRESAMAGAEHEKLQDLFALLESPKSLAKCKALLKKDASLANAREGGDEEYGRHALEVACTANNEDAVKCLVKFEADVSPPKPLPPECCPTPPPKPTYFFSKRFYF